MGVGSPRATPGTVAMAEEQLPLPGRLTSLTFFRDCSRCSHGSTGWNTSCRWKGDLKGNGESGS